MLRKITLYYDENTDEMPYCLKEGVFIVNKENNRIQGLLCNGDSCEYLFGVLLNDGILEFTIISSDGRLYDFQLKLNKDQMDGAWQKVNYEDEEFYGGGSVSARIETQEYSISDYIKTKDRIKLMRENLNSQQVEIIRRLFLGYCGTLEKVFKWEHEELEQGEEFSEQEEISEQEISVK